ncbi:hypothetical protein F5B17DRAFT_359588 [Nemania serpens]|nr:hypothetical protein F5B17DRAFT_359588 [Nemania serpens]
MAAWNNSSSRDGWIAPNNYFPPNGTSDANSDTANFDIGIGINNNNNNTNNNFHHYTHHNIHSINDIDNSDNNIATVANDVNTHANPSIIAPNEDDATVNIDDLLRAFDDPDFQHFIVGDTLQGYRSPFPPLLGPLNDDLLLASIDHRLSMSSSWFTHPNRIPYYPRSHINHILGGALVPPSLQTPLPTPPAQTLEQVPPPVEAPASSYHDRDSNLRFSGQFIRRPGTHHFHDPLLRNYQFQSFSDTQGNNQNPLLTAAPSLPSPAATPRTPTPLSQPSMSNINPHSSSTVSQARPSAQAIEAHPGIDDYFLATLATGDFSSPSLPPQSNLPSPTTLSPARRSKLATTGQEIPLSSTRRRTLNRGGEAADSIKEEETDLDTPTSDAVLSLPSAAMPPTTRRRSLAGAADSSSRKRRPSSPRSSSYRPIKTRRKVSRFHDDGQPSPFDDDDLFEPNGREGSETIDLSNATEVPAELVAPKVDNRVKISKFQCVICMDDTTALTVTHCGHLFCSECLHSSLHIDSLKRTCPVCRAKIDLKDTKGKKSYYHLELKVMTATKKGKLPAGA